MRGLKARAAIAIAIVGVGIVGAVLWALDGPSGPRATQRGAELAATYCGACHIEPAPDILPKRSWEAALGYMGYWLGITDLGFLDDHPDFARHNVESRHEVLLRDNVFPSAPALSPDDWAELRNFYVASAPAAPLPQAGKPALEWQMARFDVFRTSYRPVPVAVTTLVHVNEDAQEIYLGDSGMRALTVLGSDGRIKAAPRQFRPDITPIDLEFVGGTAYLGSIGDLMSSLPSEARPAHIAAIDLVNGSLASADSRVVVDGLYRMADMKPVDLNGDGRLDFIVCGFGGLQGSVSWFEAQADGAFTEHVLVNRPGGVKAEVHDFNDDGRLDVAVLVADAREGLYILENRGDGEFTTHAAFETHPAYGHTYLELQDFNTDGRMDLLVVNGDNVDSDPYNTRKSYHGIRIYLNRGGYDFEEAYFYPMYGAFVAKAADFDADGDLDIAAIAFYPDFEAERRESFTYLENDGGLTFNASTNDTVMSGRWMTMDIGDIDGDDDVDVVLGGGYIPVGMFAYMDRFEALARTGSPALILKNTLR